MFLYLRQGITLTKNKLLVYRFALPLAGWGDGRLECFCQGIDIGYVVAVDGPGFGLFLGCARIAIDDNADAFPVWEEFFFDARELFPTKLYYFPISTPLHQRVRLQLY